MKVSLNWLSQFCDISEIRKKYSDAELAHIYSIHTAEIDDIFVHNFPGVVVGKIISTKKHKNSDKLNIVQVDLWELWTKQIVCGAANVIDAQYVPVATIWTCLSEDFIIKEAELRWEKSEGMICGADEIGLQEERASGILQLEEIFSSEYLEKKIGTPFFDLELPAIWGGKYKLADTVFEIDNKFITNRPDLFSITGNAREMSVKFEKNLVHSLEEFSWDTGEVKIESEKVLSYHLVSLKNITIKKSPFLVELLLYRSGISVRNNFVDITNYLQVEYGQPMHVFDADKISGDIRVSEVQESTEFEALDDKKYTLEKGDIIIRDDEKILALAGIIWGKESAVSDTTKNITFEIATFDSVQVRKTSSRIGLRTDSLMRYEKALDPTLPVRTLARLEEILKFYGITEKFEDYKKYENWAYISEILSKEVSFSHDFLEKKVGMPIESDKIIKILEGLGFLVEKKDAEYLCKIPSWRATKDISIPEDMVEEIIRIIGYDTIPDISTSKDFRPTKIDTYQEYLKRMTDYFSGRGCKQIITYSFIDPEKEIQAKKEKQIILQKPFSLHTSAMRQNLFLNLIESSLENKKKYDNFILFESGKIFEKINDGHKENTATSLIAVGKNLEDFKEILVGYGKKFFPNEKIIISQKNIDSHNEIFHPKGCAVLQAGGEKYAVFGYIHPEVASCFGLEDSVLLADIFSHNESEVRNFQQIEKYPGIIRELNFVMEDVKIIWEICEKIQGLHEYIKNISIGEIYTHPEQIGVNKKSVIFKVEIRDNTSTITDEQALEIQNLIIDSLKKDHIELRWMQS